MAKPSVNIVEQTSRIIGDVKSGRFSPVYVLMGEEPYYPDMICDAIIENALDESERDFNQTVCYGADVDAPTVISAARRFPMMAERQIVVVKEAQMMKDIETFSLYVDNPLDSTVFVLLLRGASLDKRKALYKSAVKNGIVVESPAIKEYDIARWISSYYASRGLDIEPDAARLLGEYAGTELSTIVTETDKLTKNLPEGATKVTVDDIEKNVGVSRQFSIFELTKELSAKNAPRASLLAARIGSAAQFNMPQAVSALFLHFYRILKYEALLQTNPHPSQEEKSSVLGVPPFFFREYDAAVRNYPLRKTMNVISLLNDYDFKGKGGDIGPETAPGDILVELVTKIICL